MRHSSDFYVDHISGPGRAIGQVCLCVGDGERVYVCVCVTRP